jgi:hypothetical protein
MEMAVAGNLDHRVLMNIPPNDVNWFHAFFHSVTDTQTRIEYYDVSAITVKAHHRVSNHLKVEVFFYNEESNPFLRVNTAAPPTWDKDYYIRALIATVTNKTRDFIVSPFQNFVPTCITGFDELTEDSKIFPSIETISSSYRVASPWW